MSSETLIKKERKSWLHTFINRWFIPFAEKMGNQNYLSVIGNTFTILIPLIITGAFVLLVNNAVFGN
ncbi:hypothetical protein [Spiroplasma endosymbiont of Eupeodes luniger]|uniref:hypothetical protein n=1 Tax=Spiroplasma endosymbiont of Eupeodes luniger TaxID=3066300 RepID=UPI0030D1B72A